MGGAGGLAAVDGGREAEAAGGIDGLVAGMPGAGGREVDAGGRDAAGAPVSGGLAAGGIGGRVAGAPGTAGLAPAGGGGRAPGETAGREAPGGGGRDITIVLPAAPGAAGALGAAGGDGREADGGAPGLADADAAARGFARICFTCSISCPESKGLGMCPLAPTAIAFAGSIAPPPRSKTGTSLVPASARIFWQSS
jgi:hypothetical protein